MSVRKNARNSGPVTSTSDSAKTIETVKEYITWDGNIYKRMTKYMSAKGLLNTQAVARLAVSHLLDKEGF